MIQNIVTISFGNISLLAVSCFLQIHSRSLSGECFGATVELCQHFDTLEKVTQEQALFRVDSMVYKQVGERYGREKGPDIALQRARGGN